MGINKMKKKIIKAFAVYLASGHAEVKLIYRMTYDMIRYKMWLIFWEEKRIENNCWPFQILTRTMDFIDKIKQNTVFFYIIHLYFRKYWFNIQNQCSISSFHLSNEFVWNWCQSNWCWWILDNNSVTWWFWLTFQWNPFALFFGIFQ